MALNTNDPEAEQPAAREDVADRDARVRRFLEMEVWPLVPPEHRGRPISKAEQEEILGIGPDGG